MIASICVIALNEEKAIPSLLQNLCEQDYTHQQMEIILVDSESTDKTRDLMETFKKQNEDFKSIVILNNPMKLQAPGWNVAIRAATGDVVIRVDAHAKISTDFIRKNMECIDAGEYVSGGPRLSIVESESPWPRTLLLAESSMFGSGVAPYRRKTSRKTYVKSVFHGAYRKEVFEDVGLFNENLGRTEDNEMHYRIRKAGYKISFSPDIISYQYVRPTWKGIIKQKHANGYWVALTLGVCPQCLSAYHFIPLIFILVLAITTLLACAGHNVVPLAAVLLVYGIANICMAFLATKNEKKVWHQLLLPIIFLSVHMSYGLGSLMGLIKMPFWSRDKR